MRLQYLVPHWMHNRFSPHLYIHCLVSSLIFIFLSLFLEACFPVSSFCVCVYAKSLQSCPTLCNSMNCSPSGSFVHGILQARILEWFAISSWRGFSQPRDWTWVSCISWIGRQVLYQYPLFQRWIRVSQFKNVLYTWSWVTHGLPWWLRGKESAFQWGRHRFNPWVRKNGNPLQYCCLENPMVKGVWQAIYGPWVHKRVRYNLETKQQQLGYPGQNCFCLVWSYIHNPQEIEFWGEWSDIRSFFFVVFCFFNHESH